MYSDMNGKIAIVTGAAQGIGKAIAETLTKNGVTVVVSDILVEAGEATKAELGGSCVFEPCDISDPTQVETLIAKTVERFGRLDIMVNNAGKNSIELEDRVTIDKYPIETWQKMIDINLNGTFYCCKHAAAQMVSQKSGSIINISSIAGVVALRLQVGFVAAKAAILKMTEAMACELAPQGIRVNAVSPGSTMTEVTRKMLQSKEGMADKLVSFIPQGRFGEVEEMANAVAYLASDAASYVNGQNIIVDGGWTCGFNRDF